MTFTEIFSAYYTLYRAEATVPASTDDEYTIGLRFANEALLRWANYDGVYWKELFTTLQLSGDGDSTVATGTTTYNAPDNFREAGGFIKVKNSAGTVVQTYPIIEPQDAQFRNDVSTYAYFSGDPNNGYVLNLNPAPTSTINGMSIDYIYYMKPTEFTTGSDVSECPNPYFIVHRMLGQRFRASRNPYYTSALRDAEDILGQMKMDNDSGNWADPWKLQDNSGSVWGSESGGFW